MKCKLKISAYCLKTFPKKKVAYINNQECCENCFNKYKRDLKSTKKPVGRPYNTPKTNSKPHGKPKRRNQV